MKNTFTLYILLTFLETCVTAGTARAELNPFMIPGQPLEATMGTAVIPLDSDVSIFSADIPFIREGILPSVPMGTKAVFRSEMFLQFDGASNAYKLYLYAPARTILFSSTTGVFRPSPIDASVLQLDLSASPGNAQVYFQGKDRLTFLRFDMTNHIGRLISMHSSTGLPITYSYDSSHRLTSTDDSMGNVTRYFYDETGRLSRVTSPNGMAKTYAYDSSGHLQSVAGPGGPMYELTWKPLGRQGEIDPSSPIAAGAAESVPTSVKDSYSGFATDYSYGGDGLLWRYGVVDGPQTYFGYDEANTVRVNAADGSSTRYTFDRSNGTTRLSRIVDDEGNTTAYQYGTGQTLYLVTGVTHTLIGGNGIAGGSYTTGFSFGIPYLSQPTAVTKGGRLLLTNTYDAETGILTGSTDRSGVSVSRVLDAGTKQVITESTSGGEMVSYEYSPTSHYLVRTTRNGMVSSRNFNSYNQTLSQTAHGLTTAYQYGDGNCYDITCERNILLSVTHPDGTIERTVTSATPLTAANGFGARTKVKMASKKKSSKKSTVASIAVPERKAAMAETPGTYQTTNSLILFRVPPMNNTSGGGVNLSAGGTGSVSSGGVGSIFTSDCANGMCSTQQTANDGSTFRSGGGSGNATVSGSNPNGGTCAATFACPTLASWLQRPAAGTNWVAFDPTVLYPIRVSKSTGVPEQSLKIVGKAFPHAIPRPYGSGRVLARIVIGFGRTYDTKDDLPFKVNPNSDLNSACNSAVNNVVKSEHFANGTIEVQVCLSRVAGNDFLTHRGNVPIVSGRTLLDREAPTVQFRAPVDIHGDDYHPYNIPGTFEVQNTVPVQTIYSAPISATFDTLPPNQPALP